MTINDKWVLIKKRSDWDEYKINLKKLITSPILSDDIDRLKPSHRYPFAIICNVGYGNVISVHTMPRKIIVDLYHALDY